MSGGSALGGSAPLTGRSEETLRERAVAAAGKLVDWVSDPRRIWRSEI